jgi:hypothetical protein
MRQASIHCLHCVQDAVLLAVLMHSLRLATQPGCGAWILHRSTLYNPVAQHKQHKSTCRIPPRAMAQCCIIVQQGPSQCMAQAAMPIDHHALGHIIRATARHERWLDNSEMSPDKIRLAERAHSTQCSQTSVWQPVQRTSTTLLYTSVSKTNMARNGTCHADTLLLNTAPHVNCQPRPQCKIDLQTTLGTVPAAKQRTRQRTNSRPEQQPNW